jgi:murein DD-endopeptidase MepM/ murein hydrolase activator NlpD
MRSVIDRIGVRRNRTNAVRRGRNSDSIYLDSAPAGDPTYDPHGTSRPFRPTHRTHAGRQQKRPSYLDVERSKGVAQTPVNKVTEALRQNLQWRLEDTNPFEKLRVAGYGAAAIVAGIAVLTLGGSLLSQQFPMGTKSKEVVAVPAAATGEEPAEPRSTKTTKNETSSSKTIGAPETRDDAGAAATAQPGMPMVEGISDSTMRLYVNAARSCNMPWQILAGVGRIETNHGTSDAPGVKSGANSAGAKGPMQFMPATWSKYGLDANKDGKVDVYNQIDAVYSAASYLCANGAGAGKNGIDNALWHYNHSDSYVADVKRTAAGYLADAYYAPLPVDSVSDSNVTKDHHDYPAADLPVPAGTPVFAVRKGTVNVVKNGACGWGIELQGTDGVKYTYCHASELKVADGAKVDAGTVLLLSGGVPGAAGAGESTGPHLHFEMTVAGNGVCPQSVLKKWMKGDFTPPDSAAATGCSY